MRIAINGFGRIGRNVFKAGLEKGINFVAINDMTETKALAYLLKYDSVYGIYKKEIKAEDGRIVVNGKRYTVTAVKDPSQLPWREMDVDVVVESTGFFRKKEDAEKHLRAGADRVIISAPSDDADITVVMGVNHKSIKSNHRILSNASCTTNCLAPLLKVLNDSFGVKNGFMTTVHGYTSSQGIVDRPHHKYRRGRAAAVSIVPTTSGATKATVKTIPQLSGKLNGLALRVPVPDGSITDFVANLKKNVTVDKVNNAYKNAAKGKLKGILDYTEEELVSSDIIGNPHSCIIDGLSTQVVDGNLVKVLGWYDNEWGYSSRMADLINYLSKQ